MLFYLFWAKQTQLLASPVLFREAAGHITESPSITYILHKFSFTIETIYCFISIVLRNGNLELLGYTSIFVVEKHCLYMYKD